MLKRTSMALAAVTLVVIMAATMVLAAPAGRMGGRLVKRANPMTAERFAANLGLAPEQTQQVKSIVTSLRADVKAAVSATNTREDKRAAVTQLRGAARDRISMLLTEEQKSKPGTSRMIARLLSPRPALHRQRLMVGLGLTPDQKTQIRTLMGQTQTQVRAVREDASLTPEAKRASIQEIRKSSRQSLLALLTPEQKDKLLQWRQNRPGAKGARQGVRPFAAK